MKNLQILICLVILFFLSSNIQAQKSSFKTELSTQDVKVKVSMSEKYSSARKYAKINHILKDGKGDIYIIKSNDQ